MVNIWPHLSPHFLDRIYQPSNYYLIQTTGARGYDNWRLGNIHNNYSAIYGANQDQSRYAPCFFLVMDNRLKMALQLFCLGHKLETQAPSVKIQK